MANFIFFAKGKPATWHNVSRFPEDVRLEKDDGTNYEVFTDSYHNKLEEYLVAYEKDLSPPSINEVFNVARKLGVPPIIIHL